MTPLKKITLLIFLLPYLALAGQPDLLLLKTYDGKKNVVGYMMSEKLDGVRGFWDGRQLLTRGGKVIKAPKWFVAGYPPFAIDGELWTKRGDFETISSIVRRQNPDNRWRQISHQIFEVPQQKGGLLERLAILQNYLTRHTDTPIRILKQTLISEQKQVKQYLNEVVKKGGEGIVVRDGKIAPQIGRSSSALKVKQYLDNECVVKKILLGKGKYKNVMGSILCEMADGKKIKIGSGFADKERKNPPKIGDEITFKYYGLSKKGKPKYPVFLRIKP